MTRNLYPTSISIAFLYLYYLYGSLAFVPSGKLYRTSFPCWRKISHNDCPRQWSVQSMLMNSPEKTEMVPDVGDAQGSDDDDDIDMVEQLGRGSAKAKRGKRKGGTKDEKKKTAASLTPEDVFYEGPPAITETIAPTISILTVVGIIPAAAAWARQAWVRYKITTRRIRVTSGIGGKDMAEIVYPDIVELRTAKRLFGDGDMVAFLRDGAKFEMRNVPNFQETIEFILKQVNDDVAANYRQKGDVTKK